MPVNGHSRKGSLLVGEGIDIKKGPIAFGSVDSPSNFLSSSPAAPSLIGGHLANSVQAFGSVPADSSSSSNDIIKDSRRPNMTTATTHNNAAGGGGKKPFDVHQFFVGKPASNPGPNPNTAPGPTAGPPSVTSPPPMNGHPMPQGQYRPAPQQMMQQGQMRPQNGPGYPQRPMMMGQQPGMPPQYAQHGGPQNPYMMQQYPGYGYYPPSYEQQQHYPGQAQWQAQQQQQHRPQPNAPYVMSPRGSQNGLPPQSQPSPAHAAAQLPGNGSISPAPTPPSRPASHMAPQPPSSNPSIPGTPVRPPSQPLSAGPAPPSFPQHLSGGAQTFTPRKSAAIQIRRPDGSVIDPKEAASPAPKASPATATASTPDEKPSAPESAIKKKSPFPVMVRIESEEAKKARLEEEAVKERFRKEDEVLETEKKERKERQAREADEKRLADEAKAKDDSEKASKAKEDEAKAAEEKKKLDEALAAEQDAKVKRDAEIAAVEKAAKDKEDQQAKNEIGATHAVADAAREKADEQRRSLLTTDSAAASPLSSPRLAAAGLPPKPSAAASNPAAATRRPAPLDLKPSTPQPSEGQSSALSTAKPIADLNAVTYATPIQSPSATLNEGAEPGKFRYDRVFLLQFMSVCKEKPQSLPPLEEIGLEADTSSSFGKRGSRSSVAGTPRSGGTGLGISGGNQRYPSQGMGNFGAFGSGQIGSLRGTSSDDRYRNSIATAGGRGGRTPSQQGMQPPMGGRMGGNRSGRGRPRPPQATFQNPEPGVQALVTTENAWVTAGRKLGDDDKRSVAFISRKVNALLNKLTAEKFESISNQVLEYANYSIDEENGQTMKLVIQLIFEKATDEALWGPIYARLCRKLYQTVDDGVKAELDGKVVTGGALFRKYMIGRCQYDFEAGWKEREEAALKAAERKADDAQRLDEQANKEEGAEPAVLSDEYYALQKIKRRGLGLITLIGELFKLEMVSKGVMGTCFVKMLGRGQEIDEEDVESAVKLLKTIGPVYDAQSGENVEGILGRLMDIQKSEGTSPRTKFMIMDLMELRNAGWKGKGATQSQTANMTIAEVHQQAAREEAEQRRATQASISRGGSRVGQQRGGNDWQQTPAAPRPSRPADFSNIGRLSSSSAGPSFGPQSTFGRNRRGGAAGNSTPPISRQASQANIPNMSNANQFALLNESSEASGSAEPAPQRRKLKLAPRTVPKNGEEGAEGEQGEDDDEGDDDEEGSGSEDEAPEQKKEISEDGAKAKIDLDMKELWGEKDQGGSRNPDDIVHYFTALPETFRSLLANKLYDEIFRTAKYKDAEVVAKGLAKAIEAGATTLQVLKDGLGKRMETLDDDSIDFPQAYKAIALLMRSLSLSPEDIDELVAKVDVYGEPKVTPRMKLDKEFTRLDDEAASASA